MSGQQLGVPVRFKYWMDRVAAFVIIIASLPVLLLIAVSIAFEALLTGEPLHILVGEKRQSAGRTFHLLKFRVFRVDALREHLATKPSVSVKAIEKKPENLTRVGRLLKRFYLDELAQLLNILSRIPP